MSRYFAYHLCGEIVDLGEHSDVFEASRAMGNNDFIQEWNEKHETQLVDWFFVAEHEIAPGLCALKRLRKYARDHPLG